LIAGLGECRPIEPGKWRLIVGTPEDDADAALFALLSSLRGTPPRPLRTYTGEFVNGEWVFRRCEMDLMFEEIMEKALGLEPDADDDRRYGFKLP
jgi:hypothetical protein